MRMALDPGREARLRFAFYACWDARGDRALLRERIEQLVELDQRLRAEQLAESGYLPATFEGCVAVVEVALRVCAVLNGDADVPPPPRLLRPRKTEKGLGVEQLRPPSRERLERRT